MVTTAAASGPCDMSATRLSAAVIAARAASWRPRDHAVRACSNEHATARLSGRAGPTRGFIASSRGSVSRGPIPAPRREMRHRPPSGRGRRRRWWDAHTCPRRGDAASTTRVAGARTRRASSTDASRLPRPRWKPRMQPPTRPPRTGVPRDRPARNRDRRPRASDRSRALHAARWCSWTRSAGKSAECAASCRSACRKRTTPEPPSAIRTPSRTAPTSALSSASASRSTTRASRR